jgi:hypothetical protein
MGVPGMKKEIVEAGFVAEKQQTLRIHVESTQWIDVFREPKIR